MVCNKFWLSLLNSHPQHRQRCNTKMRFWPVIMRSCSSIFIPLWCFLRFSGSGHPQTPASPSYQIFNARRPTFATTSCQTYRDCQTAIYRWRTSGQYTCLPSPCICIERESCWYTSSFIMSSKDAQRSSWTNSWEMEPWSKSESLGGPEVKVANSLALFPQPCFRLGMSVIKLDRLEEMPNPPAI